ncbi:MAG: hypothetical protein Q4C85_07600 [Actinomyces sp.]|uniref:carboxylesterase family protein n=1 Tax=Actinomyces sp. TaxID=29317 RepID=UPI0026DB2F6F|nr:hypothetical protein [Actinomyces sp.]MDO4243607.1 hypothetical protein [Actinomyces sp.]
MTFESDGQSSTYNLYVPEDFDPSKSDPLVLFMHDSASVSDDSTYTLEQGIGADVWASEEVQSFEQAFVLAPQFSEVIANDDFELTGQGELVIPLIDSLKQEYSLDDNRIYTTGQSMGSMASMALNIAHPDYFAASYYVTGQWDPTAMQKPAGTKMTWIASLGDEKAGPAMDTFKEYLDGVGVDYATDIWDGRWSSVEYDQATSELYAQGKDINLVSYAEGSVTPPLSVPSASTEHIFTWYRAYLAGGVHEWLLSQSR